MQSSSSASEKADEEEGVDRYFERYALFLFSFTMNL